MLFKRTSLPPNIVLSFRADGPYWSDLVHLLAYPVGISYIWPFRYGADLVEPSLRDEFDSVSARDNLRGSPILVGARFQTAQRNKFVPIRRATIIQVDSSTGIYSFLFRLGPAMDFVGKADLATCAVELTQHVDHLAFRADLGAPILKDAVPGRFGPSWKEFASLIVRERVLPLNGEAKRSVFFHVLPIQSADGDVSPARIFKSWSKEDVFGFQLKEGHRYVLKFSHYVPCLEENTTVREFIVEPKLPTSNVESNKAQITLIGNYGVESVLLGAARPSETWEELVLAPTEKIYTAQDGTSTVIPHQIKVPVRVTWSLSRWIVRTLLPASLLFIALSVLGAANLFDKLLAKIVDKTLTLNAILDQWPLIALILVASGMASLSIPWLQARINK
jgi:hypothetical protein